jgi:hypothetical protein
MTDPKRRFRGQTDLGRTIDERIAARDAQLELRHDTGTPPAVPLSGGGATGGGGGGDDPAFPESCVESLRLDAGGTARSGAVVLEDAGLVTITDKVAEGGSDRAFEVAGVSVLSVASLPGSPAGELIYRRLSDQTLWWHDGTDWHQLAIDNDTCYWELDGSAITPVSGRALQLVKTGEVTVLTARQSGDSVARLAVDSAGALSWGDGTAGQDLELRRGAAHRLELADGDWLRLPAWLELAEISAAGCTTAPSGHARLLAASGRAYLRDDQSSLHDLTVQHEQTLWVGEDLDGHGHVTVPWCFGAAPDAAGLPSVGSGADPTATSRLSSSAPASSGDPALLTMSYGRFSWEPVHLSEPPPGLSWQAWVAVGAPVAKCGDYATGRVRLRVNSAALFASVKLSIMDHDGSNIASQAITPTTSWAEYSVSANDMSGWTGPLRLALTAEGVCGSAAALTQLDIEYLAVTQWTA